MNIYNKLIRENVAPVGTKQIIVCNDKGVKVGVIPLNRLRLSDTGAKLYSFGAISDVHIPYTTGEADLINTLNYFNSETDAEFICISGDLADNGTDTQLAQFKSIVEANSKIPVYVSAGNHDAYDSSRNLRVDTAVSASMQTYTGNPLYYSFERGNDVFIFVGVCEGTFSKAELQWLYEILERCRNRRCFLYQHVFAYEGCGNIYGLYDYNLTGNDRYTVFKSLLKHYHNIIWFHGHSHTMFHGQEFGMTANYDNAFGCHSIHVPSNAVPRTDKDGDMTFQTEYQESEGYLVDVYENGIHLKGRDFVKGEFLPIASYWLDTTIIEIAANTYTDATNTITTG